MRGYESVDIYDYRVGVNMINSNFEYEKVGAGTYEKNSRRFIKSRAVKRRNFRKKNRYNKIQ